MSALIVNLFGPPNSGKTSLAGELFVRCKRNGISATMVPEFATDLVMEGNRQALSHQWYVTGTQAYRIWCASQRVKVVFVDSPILLGPIYDIWKSPALKQVCFEHHDRENNMNIFVDHIIPTEHSMASRVHTPTESLQLGLEILHFLDTEFVPYSRTSDFVPNVADNLFTSIETYI